MYLMRFYSYCPGDLVTRTGEIRESGRFGLYPGDSRIIRESWHRCKWLKCIFSVFKQGLSETVQVCMHMYICV